MNEWTIGGKSVAFRSWSNQTGCDENGKKKGGIIGKSEGLWPFTFFMRYLKWYPSIGALRAGLLLFTCKNKRKTPREGRKKSSIETSRRNAVSSLYYVDLPYHARTSCHSTQRPMGLGENSVTSSHLCWGKALELSAAPRVPKGPRRGEGKEARDNQLPQHDGTSSGGEGEVDVGESIRPRSFEM